MSSITHIASIDDLTCPYVLGLCRGLPVLVTAAKENRNDIALWNAQSSHSNVREPLAVLSGHQSSLVHFCISQDSKWLLSISDDTWLLWEMDYCMYTDKVMPNPRAQSPGFPNMGKGLVISCFSPCNTRTFVTSGGGACLINTQNGSCTGVDVSSISNWSMTSASFCDSTCLVIGLEDRSFIIWDFNSCSVVYQSSIYPTSFTSIECTQNYVVMGTNNGMVKIFSIEGLLTRSCDSVLHTIDLSHDQASCDVRADIECEDQSVIGLYAFENTLEIDNVTGLFYILVIKRCGLAFINGYNKDILLEITASDPISSLISPHLPTITLPHTIHTTSITSTTDNKELIFSLSGLFNGEMLMLKLNTEVSCQSIPSVISVVSSSPLLPTSVLKTRSLQPSLPQQRVAAAATESLSQRKKLGKDQPLTFRNKIKSSGYTQQPRMTMFKPQTNFKSTVSTSTSAKSNDVAKVKKFSSSVKNDTDMGVAKQYLRGNMSLNHNFLLPEKQPIKNCVFTGNGSQLLYSVGKTLFTMKPLPSPTPLMRHLPLDGHDSDITDAGCSHDNQWAVTSSNDKTCKIWRLDSSTRQLLMNMETTMHNCKDKPMNKDNICFPSPINHCSFYYLDKFIILSYGNKMALMKYYLDTNKGHDVKRYLTKSYYKRVSQTSLDPSVKSITALSCINDFYTYLIYVGGSDRSLHVYDMNEMKWVWSIDNAHKRPINCITQNKGSKFITVPSTMSHDLFMTSSISDGLKLWDTRSQSCVRWYTSHCNSSQPVSSCFSPCGRYIATGSEDKMVYLYDLRKLTPLDKLVCKTSVVSTVSYHPYKPMIACGTLEGELNFFESV